MTQESENPEESKPAEAPSSAWAPRPQATSASSPPESSSETPSAPESPTSETTSDTPEASESAAAPEAATPSDTAVAVAPSEPESPPPAPSAKRSGVPVWLLVIAAIVPAVIVGIAVYFATNTSSEDDSTAAAGVVDGLMRLGQSDQSNISSYAGELPPDFSTEFPIYTDAKIVVSIAIASEQGTGYLIVMSTPDSTSDVFTFYSDALDKDPWQVEIGRSSEEFTGVRFLRPDNIDISGDVSLHRSTLDDQTVIYLSYSDISQAILPGGDTDPFTVGISRPLPQGFPEEIPIYAGTEESVILDTYFERGQGGQAFIVTFLTKDSQDDVIEYYRNEFEGRGWTVSDAGVSSTSFALGIEFDDGPDQSVSGSITADSFDSDPEFTQVDLLVTTNNN